MSVVPPLFGRLRPWALAVFALLGAAQAQAGLFDDDEARRAILEMRQQRAQDQERLTALGAQVDQLKRSLLEMNTQLELLRNDLAQQRGQGEVLQRDLADVQRKQKDQQAAQDERLRKLEPQTVTVDGKTFKAEADEKRDYEDALAHLRAADFDAGVKGLTKLLQQYPQTGYRETAWYWQGNGQYGLRQYKEAIQAFRQLVERAPDHPRTPEALLSIANCYSELKDSTNARRSLEQLVKQYPKTEAAQAARDRLLTMSPPARKSK